MPTSPAARGKKSPAAGRGASSGRPAMIRDCPAYIIARPDMGESAVSRLRTSGWRGELKIIPAQRRETHEKSCCAAHRAAVEAGMEAGVYPFFIIEDDAHPTRWQRELPLPLKGSADGLRLDLSVCSWNTAANTWETSPEWEPVDADWVRLVNMLGAAAVGLCSRTMARAYRESAIRGEALGIPIDVLTSESGRKYRILALRRPLFYQGPQTNHNAAGTDIVLTGDSGPPVPALKAALSEGRRQHEPVTRCVHQIWLGSRPVPEHFLPWMDGVSRFAAGWDYRLWRDADLPEILPRSLLPELIDDPGQNPGLRADILRYEILRQLGGVYFDCDYELLEPLAHLLVPGCLHYGDELPGRPAIGLLASPPGHEFWGFLLRRIRRGAVHSPATWQDIVQLSGPDAFSAALWDWTGHWKEPRLVLHDEKGQPYATHFPGSDLVAFQQETVYPYWYETHTWREFSRERYPLARAAHHWGGSWQ